MDYYAEGEKCRKIFGNINKISDFKEYVYNIVFANANEFNKAEFVRGLLDKTKNETLFIYANGIAVKTEKSEPIWGEIFSAFNNLIKGKNKPQWAFSFLSTSLQTNDLKLNNSDVSKVVYATIHYDDTGALWWLNNSRDKTWFKTHIDTIERYVLEYATNYQADRMNNVFSLFSNMEFYNNLIKKIGNANGHLRLFNEMLLAIKIQPNGIKGFSGGDTIDTIMNSYTEKFRSSAIAMDTLTDLLKNFNTLESGRIFVDLLSKTAFKIESNVEWLRKIEDDVHDGANYIKSTLYDYTGDEKYLPQEARDIFLF